MGHVRLGVLPASRKWRQVVAELGLGAEVDVIAASATEAAEAALRAASSDSAFLHTFWLLTQVPLAARGPDFAENLRHLGIEAPDQPSLMDLVAGISGAVDKYARESGDRTDFGEMAQMSAAESFVALVAPNLPSLFEPNPGEVQRAVGRLAGGDRFSTLAREFFARLTQRTLDYYLSRELSNHIGIGKRFEDDRARSQFDAALGTTLPGSIANCRGVRRRMVRQERLSWRRAHSGCRSPVRPGCFQKDPGRAPEAPRCSGVSISSFAVASTGRQGPADPTSA
jgi:hypothetical protein